MLRLLLIFLFFGSVYAYPVYDTDGDGIIDQLDGCVTVPEVFNGYHDNDGCPDMVYRLPSEGGGMVEYTLALIANDIDYDLNIEFIEEINNYYMITRFQGYDWTYGNESRYSTVVFLGGPKAYYGVGEAVIEYLEPYEIYDAGHWQYGNVNIFFGQDRNETAEQVKMYNKSAYDLIEGD